MEWSEEEEEDDSECLLLLLCDYFDLFDLLFLLWESDEDLEEEEEDDDLCLLLFDLYLFLGKSLQLHLEDVCLLSETQILLGGAMITRVRHPTEIWLYRQ